MEEPEDKPTDAQQQPQMTPEMKACRIRYLLAEGFIEEEAPGKYKLTDGGRYYTEREFTTAMKQLFGRDFAT